MHLKNTSFAVKCMVLCVFVLFARLLLGLHKPNLRFGGSGTSEILNSTLGFESVIAVGLPERSDRRDALTLMASLTGFKLTWVDGVAASSISEKAIPKGWDRTNLLDSNLGSWRAHIDAIRHVVEEDFASALILEDDVDWDTNLKSQLLQFAGAAQRLQEGLHPHPQLSDHSPYGQNWDLLWLGSCLVRFTSAQDEPKVILQGDHTVAPMHHLIENDTFAWEDYPAQSRIVYVPHHDTVCTFGYALSRAGARKALYYLGIAEQPTTFDFHMSDLCRERPLGMRCISVVPGLFMHHRSAGSVNADSDIITKEGSEVRKIGFTENILYSTRLNLEHLVQGLEPRKQWND